MKTYRRQRNIKTKLMGAICMLLISSLMMVSTTYAWFTLSTAPEVTGITTAVGANGNLEMALLPTSGDLNDIKSDVGDSAKIVTEKNLTWGNLVDLKNGYGLDQITLYPAALHASQDPVTKNPITMPTTGVLQIPKYGADGRIHSLSPDTVTSTYVDNGFPQNNLFGVRAVGTASGMTDRQLAYRNARTFAVSAMAQAKDNAANSLSQKGNALADIAVKHGTGAESHTQAEVDSLIAIIDDLLGVNTVTSGTDEGGATVYTVTTTPEAEGILEYIEEAYRQYILAYGASAAASPTEGNPEAGMTDAEFMIFKGVVEGSATLSEVITNLDTTYGITLPTEVTGFIDKLQDTKDKVIQSRKDLAALKATGDDVKWDDIRNAMVPLANPERLTINDIPTDKLKDRVSELAQSYADRGGLTVTMVSGAGVYADVADHCGDYDANIVISEVKYGTMVDMKNVKARMETKTSQPTVYLSLVGAEVQGAGEPTGGEGSKPITDMYGYIVDLAFRTNATESNLLLQQQGADRIYDENGNEETMGHGSSMTFKATTTDFSDEQVLLLMQAIRVVFFTPGESDVNNVVATAKLDTAHHTKGADGITAMMYLYRLTAEGEPVYTQTTYEANSGKTYYVLTSATYAVDDTVTDGNFAEKKGTLYTEDGGVYTKVADDATFAEGTAYYTQTAAAEYTQLNGEPGAGQTVYTMTRAAAGEEVITSNEIMALTQNTPAQLSVLVYLDGYHVTNAAVAATAATSVTGSMNLQFASSANLVPMEYADLHLPVTETKLTAITVSGSTANPVPTATGSFNAAGKVTIKLSGLAENETVTAVSVGGVALAEGDYTYADDTLTFTKAELKASEEIEITVTSNS